MSTEIVLHKIEVRRNGKRFGYIWIGKMGIQWKSVNDKNWANVTWKEFDQVMKDRIEKQGTRKWKLD
jgi:hypothetical protein